jgi:hypothetical protein
MIMLHEGNTVHHCRPLSLWMRDATRSYAGIRGQIRWHGCNGNVDDRSLAQFAAFARDRMAQFG